MSDNHDEAEEVKFILKCLAASVIFLISHLAFYLIAPAEEFTLGLTAVLAVISVAIPIVMEAIEHFTEHKFGMNELVLIAMAGCCATYNYVDAAIIGIIMSIHEVIEHWTPKGSASSLTDALHLNKRIIVKIEGDKQVKIQADQLKVGDRIRVNPGDIFAVDGIIRDGAGTVNKSSITGESIPIDINSGDRVLAGTVNLTGSMEMEVTAETSNTVISHMDKIIKTAKETKSEFISIMDKISAPYALCVIGFCATVFFLTKDADQAISLLIVSFPDALVMAAPLAMLAALTSSSRCGVLLKSPQALIKFKDCDSIYMDKTGTVTEDKLKVVGIHATSDFIKLLKDYSIALTERSNHPVAKAVNTLTPSKKYKVSDFNEEQGLGITGTINNSQIKLGRYNWIQGFVSEKIELPQDLSIVCVAIDNKFAGYFRIEDYVRKEADAAMGLLQSNDMKVKIISGDLNSRVKSIADDLKVEYKGECLPTDKVNEIKKAKEVSNVAFIGDGLNDAPAMSVADVGISMKSFGNEFTANQAEVILLRNNLLCLPYLKELSEKTNAVITQNMICGVVFVLLGILLASLGLLPPAFAAVFHLFDAAFIVFNSARLIKVNIDDSEIIPQSTPAS